MITNCYDDTIDMVIPVETVKQMERKAFVMRILNKLPCEEIVMESHLPWPPEGAIKVISYE